MFPEVEKGRKLGFFVELSGIKGARLFLELSDRQGKAVHTIPLTKPAILAGKFRKYGKKGWQALRSVGVAGLAAKVEGKLHERRIREIPYEEWLPRHLPSPRELEQQRKHRPAVHPLISIVVPVYRTPVEYLGQLVESVMRQTYPDWELILSDASGQEDKGKSRTDQDALAERRAAVNQAGKGDSRIHYLVQEKALRISDNTNAAIAAASGEYLAFVDHDDLLEAHALYEMACAVTKARDQGRPKPRILYSDEDKVTSDGKKFYQPHFKPDYNEHLLCSVNYICHLMLMETSLARELAAKETDVRELSARIPAAKDPVVEGLSVTEFSAGNLCAREPARPWPPVLRAGFDGAQDHDLLLRAVERVSREEIVHIPRILYHWRAHEASTAMKAESKNYAFEAGKKAIEEHYARTGRTAYVTEGEYPGLYRTHWNWPDKPLVSVLIPNKDHIQDLKKCIDSLVEQTYDNMEILVIENNSTEEETFRFYKQLEEEHSNLKVIQWKREFNFSAINNFGVRNAEGQYFLLLNNDTRMIGRDCLWELLGFAMEPEVGVVGARLYYEDDTIQHAGVVIGFGGIAGHCFVMQPRGTTGYMHRIITAQEYSAVTAACMMVRREAFEKAGGMDEELAVAFNDIDFCLKIRSAGYLVVYNPYAELYHFESKSRGLEDSPEKTARFQKEIAVFERHWKPILEAGDPYYNPNLTLESQDFSRRRL